MLKLVVAVAVVAAQPLPPPPLKANETILPTATGCAGIIGYVTSSTDPKVWAKIRSDARLMHWSGPCRYGLAHGQGTMTYPAPDGYTPGGQYRADYFYGRTAFDFSVSHRTLTYRAADPGRFAEVSYDSEPESPQWTNDTSDGTSVFIPSGEIHAHHNQFCSGALADMNCNEFEIWIWTDSPSHNIPIREIECPERHSPVGCDNLWRQYAAPYIATYRQIRAEAEAAVPAWKAELTKLNAPRDAAFAALEAPARAAFDKSLAPAIAEGAQSNRTFKAKLTAANAGQLYAMADEFERAGDSGKAGQALRALLTRFPNHALAATAAQHLSALPSQRSDSGDCQAAAEEARVGAQLKGTIGSIPRDNVVGQYESVMWALQKSAAAYARCPLLANSEAKIRAYRSAYLETAGKCSLVSSTGSCSAQMH